jgi:hypothetical protein
MPITARDVKESSRLLWGQRMNVRAFRLGRRYKRRHVSCDEAPFKRLSERHAEHSPNVLDGARGEASFRLGGQQPLNVLGRKLRELHPA